MGTEQASGRAITSLADIKNKTDFPKLYDLKGLSTIQERIDFLTEELHIMESQTERPETLEQNLRGLEEFVLFFPGHYLQYAKK